MPEHTHSTPLTEGAARARAWRQAEGLGCEVIDDLAERVLRTGVEIAVQPAPYQRPLAFEQSGDRVRIVLAQHLSRAGFRYWLAHALGHRVFDAPLPSCCPPRRFDTEEARALGFATELLVPLDAARHASSAATLARWYGVTERLAARQIETLQRSPQTGFARIVILVDHREEASGVPDILATHADLDVRVVTLPVGDYIIDDTLAVERKTESDLAASVVDGRLFPQLAKLGRLSQRPILLIEEDGTGDNTRLGGPQRRGILVSALLTNGATLLPSCGPTDTALLLATCARQHARQRSRAPKRWSRGRAPRADAVLRCIPGVGPARARRLLDHFGSVRAILEAPPEQLAKVAGMGISLAMRLRDLAA